MTGRVAAVLVVPHGTHRPESLAEAIRACSIRTWEVGAVWCGDPHLRPRLDGVVWLDDATAMPPRRWPSSPVTPWSGSGNERSR